MSDKPTKSDIERSTPIGTVQSVNADGTVNVAFDISHPLVGRMLVANLVGGVPSVNAVLRESQRHGSN